MPGGVGGERRGARDLVVPYPDPLRGVGACGRTCKPVLSAYGKVMIRSFGDGDTEELFHGGNPRRIPPEVRARARRKLDAVNAAATVNDLRAPPGNMLEALHGSRKGQHSIRINDQWRICFRFEAGEAHDVEIVDYH